MIGARQKLTLKLERELISLTLTSGIHCIGKEGEFHLSEIFVSDFHLTKPFTFHFPDTLDEKSKTSMDI